MLLGFHHVAIICSEYGRSRAFYTDILGFRVLDETFREERGSWKLDLALPGGDRIELFHFPGCADRPTQPEARGLRHLAFAVADVEAVGKVLEARGVAVEPVRTDPSTGARFTFFRDPDDLPLEIYEGAVDRREGEAT